VSGAAGPAKRCFTLASARALLPDVRDRTAKARRELEALDAQREAAAGDAARIVEIDRRKAVILSHWVRSMEAFGVDVKGPWLVDFDNGQGYYCWRDPEPRLEFFHGYDEGFAGRARIQ